jgi:hypothetical protein
VQTSAQPTLAVARYFPRLRAVPLWRNYRLQGELLLLLMTAWIRVLLR